MTLRHTLLATAVLLTACQAAPPLMAPTAVSPEHKPKRTLLLAPSATTPEVRSGAGDRTDMALTVYQDGQGLVHDARRLTLPDGRVLVRFEDVSPMLDGTSAIFRAPGSGVTLLEQQFVSVPLTPATLLARYVGKEVEVRIPAEGDRPAEVVKATLVSAEGPVVRIGDRVYLQPPGQVILPEVPPDLATHPSLLWTLDVADGGATPLQATYLTAGLGWSADYRLTLPAEGDEGNWEGWVTLRNTSGLTYPDARLTVVAGNLGNVRQPPPYPLPVDAGRSDGIETQPQFDEGTLFEYHRYDLEQRATLDNGQTRQLALMTAADLDLTRIYTLDAARYFALPEQDQPVEVTLTFENKTGSGLGKPLPRGTVRIYQEDAQSTLRLIGEDALPHTAVDGTVRLRAGTAFDVVGTRRQTLVRQVSERVREESFEVVVRNRKRESVTVEVVEHVYGDYKVVAQSHPHQARSANDLVFPVTVPPGADVTLTFTIQFTTGG